MRANRMVPLFAHGPAQSDADCECTGFPMEHVWDVEGVRPLPGKPFPSE